MFCVSNFRKGDELNPLSPYYDNTEDMLIEEAGRLAAEDDFKLYFEDAYEQVGQSCMTTASWDLLVNLNYISASAKLAIYKLAETLAREDNFGRYREQDEY